MKKLIFGAVMLLMAITAKAQSEIYPQHFDLEEVTLGEGPFRTAMITNANLLLDYDAARLMTPFVRQAGLKTGKYTTWLKDHPSFSNWGLSDWSLEGHVGGHYVTALALAYAATRNDAQLANLNQQLRTRLVYCLEIMKDCQDAFVNDNSGMRGFIGGQPINDMWRQLYAGTTTLYTNKYGGWVPFYCQHKVMAGLRDAVIYGDAEIAEMAKPMFRDICDWAINVIAKFSDAQVQTLLGWEHGGINEPLADAYLMFGDAKYLKAAKRYSHTQMIDGMQTLNRTFLDGKHANTQVPKYIGFERVYKLDKTMTRYKTATLNFWTDVAEHRTVCIGGNSIDEHFLPKSKAGDYISNTDGPESCNSNNMLKLSENLFDLTHQGKYADFYENTMWNHILSTQDPTTGGYVYFTALRPQSYRIYSKKNAGMWCCVGTGMENHSKYGHFIYTHDGEATLYVNLFTPSTLTSATFGIKQETEFPYAASTKLTVTKAGSYAIAVRKPSWTGESYDLKVNGVSVNAAAVDGYVKVSREWSEGDVITVDMPMTLRVEECPDLPSYVAFKYGPILLAAKTTAENQQDAQATSLAYEKLQNEYAGEGRMDHAPNVVGKSLQVTSSPLLIGERNEVLSRIKVTDASKLRFSIDCASSHSTGNWTTLTLEPFYGIHHARYNCYWYQQTEQQYMESDMASEERAKAELEQRTVDFVGTGEQQSEAGHEASYSASSSYGSYQGEYYRDCGLDQSGYIQYALYIPDSIKTALLEGKYEGLTVMSRFQKADKGRVGDIYINGQLLRTITISGSEVADQQGFFNVEIVVPAELYTNADGSIKDKLTYKLTAHGAMCPGLYCVRLMKKYRYSSKSTYKFHAAEWAVTGDSYRVAQNKISYNEAANTITVNATGDNNVALNFNTNVYGQKYVVDAEDKYFVIQGTNLSTAAGKAYLWWLNGANHGSQVAPTYTRTLDNGDVLFAWDITASGINDNCQGTTFKFSQGNTIFGLTSTTGTSVIKNISFIHDVDEYIQTGIRNVSALPTVSQSYNLSGQKISDGKGAKQRGIVVRKGKKTVVK